MIKNTIFVHNCIAYYI
uniref:Uncharacterized protein n=1 Tax=Ignisphaera aggregans TaxID=334771 RepID=A0A7C4D151_9CREN